MRIAVISCWAYRDAWKPFFELLDKFWSDCPYPVDLLTDYFEVFTDSKRKVPQGVVQKANCQMGSFRGQRDIVVHPGSWCEELADYAASVGNEPIMLFQEDFLLTAPVQPDVVGYALDFIESEGVGCVRLYPCPGGVDEFLSDPYFASVPRGTRYRVSCQVAIWHPQFLYAIASRFKTPAEFEIEGSIFSDSLPDEVLAFKRDVKPWPMEYLCSAISRGKWNPDAKKLCDEHGIEADWTMREFA